MLIVFSCDSVLGDGTRIFTENGSLVKYFLHYLQVRGYNRTMDYNEIVQHFGQGSLTKTARKLGRPISTVHRWRTEGIPFGVQCELQLMTGGVLTAKVERKGRRRAMA
jgi:hypothetical protein